MTCKHRLLLLVLLPLGAPSAALHARTFGMPDPIASPIPAGTLLSDAGIATGCDLPAPMLGGFGMPSGDGAEGVRP